MTAEAIRICIGLLVAVASLIVWPRFIKLNAFFSLLFASFLFGAVAGLPMLEVVNTMQSGMGLLLQQIGILVALGSVLGTLLEKTGGMERISVGLLHFFGPRHTLLGLTMVGAIVGIPVFCDSGFIILSRLVPTLAVKSGTSASSLSLGLSSGLYTTHTLVPPTPGPLAGAANLGIGEEVGIVMLLGLVVALPVILVSFWMARRLGQKLPNTLEAEEHESISISLTMSLLPLLIPILLIALGTALKLVQASGMVVSFLHVLGAPPVALFIGVLLALLLVDRKRHAQWPEWVNQALLHAGLILLITGAGGSFGAVIKASGVSKIIESFVSSSHASGVVFMMVAFLVSAILKTAQGSSTSAIIIASSLMAPLASLAGIGSTTQLALLVLAIGGGAMTVSHANDSYYWVVSQFGGVPPRHMYGSYTLMSLMQGVTVLLTVLLLYIIL